MLVAQELSCGYPQLTEPVVKSVNTHLDSGDFVCVIGRNGAGKSTLMRTLAGLQAALSGHVSVHQQDVFKLSATERAKLIAVVTTEKVASPGLLVDDVLALGRLPYTNWQNKLQEEDHLIIKAACELTKVTGFLGLPLNSLSDGQRQRVMIARALAQSPQIMVLDEITAFLDLPSRVEIMAMLRKYAKQRQCIVLLSSHDLELSLELADKLWLMDGGQLHGGAPETLIDQGLIASAFDNTDIVFDQARKRFKLKDKHKELV